MRHFLFDAFSELMCEGSQMVVRPRYSLFLFSIFPFLFSFSVIFPLPSFLFYLCLFSPFPISLFLKVTRTYFAYYVFFNL